MVTFKDLVLIDPVGIQFILKEMAQNERVLSLKTASDTIKEHIYWVPHQNIWVLTNAVFYFSILYRRVTQRGTTEKADGCETEIWWIRCA